MHVAESDDILKSLKGAAEIREELERLLIHSDPMEFETELRRLAVDFASRRWFMKSLLTDLKEAWPENFKEAASSSTLPERRRRHAMSLAIFKMNEHKISQLRFCDNSEIHIKELGRWIKMYDTDLEFRALVDALIERHSSR